MIYKRIVIALSLLLCLLLAGCVTAVDGALPYADLPQITLATEVRLVASPTHPTAYLGVDSIPAGANVQVLGADTNAAWLMVLHDNIIGWMPTFFSRTNVGALKAALVVDPLAERCTEYRAEAAELDKVWISTDSGAAIVQGAIYRTERTESFSQATLTLDVDGSGAVVASDYLHTPLTPSSALILFTFAVTDLAPESRLHFTLANGGDERFVFQAVLFSNTCSEAVPVAGSQFTAELPVGQEKLLTAAPLPPALPTGQAVAATSAVTRTTAPRATTVTTSTVSADAPQGEVLLPILSTRSGPGFDYPANGTRLQGEHFTVVARVCSETGGYDWYLAERQAGVEYWLPGLSDFVEVANVATLICLPPPPARAPEGSSVTVLPSSAAGAELITDPAAFAPYWAAIGYYRLAEKAALALPNSPAVRQLPDFAQANALLQSQAAIRQLRTQRANTVLAIDQLTIKLVVTFNDGTASVLAQETHSATTQRPAAVGSEVVADVAYRGPVLYALRYRNGQWKIHDVVLLGESGDLALVETSTAPTKTQTVDSAVSEQLALLLANKEVHAVPGSAPTLLPDASAFLQPSATVIEGAITANTVLKATASPYLIQGEVTVANGVTLLIEPGAIVKFNDDSFLNIDGVLNARSTADNPITFTSSKDDLAGGDTNGDGSASTPAPGDWTMLRFRDASNDVNSIIEHAVIRYAGEHRGNGFGAIHLEAASPTLINNVIEESFWYAISGDLASFPILSGNVLARNGGNGFAVREGQMVSSGVWRNIDMPYTLFRPITVLEGATLTLEPGVVVKFADDVYVDVYGAFKATGSGDDPVIFTSLRDDAAGGDTNGDGESTAPAAGDWTMIRFYDASNDANSLIEHAIIRYAGEHRGTPFGAIHLEAAAPTITHNTFEDNAWYAISGDVHSFPTIAGNTVQHNVGNGFEIRAGAMTTSGVWRNTDIPYTLLGVVTVNDGATLNIEPGVIVKLGNDAYFDINGAFRALGAAEAPIIFTSLRDDTIGGDTNGDQNSSAPSAGDWNYIGFKDTSNDTNSIIDHAVIRYGGEWRNQAYGPIYLEAASPTITNNTLEQNFGYAISADVNCFPIVQGNQIANNAGNGLFLREGRMAISGIWRNTDIAYTILGNVGVNEGTLLTIDPGVVVKFGDDAYLEIFGAFKALGTQATPITFTSLRDDTIGGDTNGDGAATVPTAGDWTYIGFKDTSNDVNSRIEYSLIRYAGEWRNAQHGAIHLEGASPTLVNNTIEASFAYGIWRDANSSPQLDNNTFNNNAAEDVFTAQ